MNWKKCTLYKKTFSTDKLNNQIPTGEEAVLETRCRFTPWTDEEIALEGREVTRNEQKYAIPIPKSRFPECDKAQIKDVGMVEIKEITGLSPRWTVIRIKGYKK